MSNVFDEFNTIVLGWQKSSSWKMSLYCFPNGVVFLTHPWIFTVVLSTSLEMYKCNFDHCRGNGADNYWKKTWYWLDWQLSIQKRVYLTTLSGTDWDDRCPEIDFSSEDRKPKKCHSVWCHVFDANVLLQWLAQCLSGCLLSVYVKHHTLMT